MRLALFTVLLLAGAAVAQPTLWPPSGVSAEALSATEIEITWTDTNGPERGYSVERAPSAGGPWREIHRTEKDAVRYVDQGLEAETTYFYRLRAFR